MMKNIELIFDGLKTLAILAGSYVAIQGLSTWKRQLRGSNDYQLARRYLKAAYLVREAISDARNPFIYSGEMIAANKAMGMENADKLENITSKETRQNVYSQRLIKVAKAMTDLNVEQLEAEVSWGQDATVVATDLTNKVNRLFISVQQFLMDDSKDMEILYSAGKGDKFEGEIQDSIRKIEDFLKPHLK